MSDLRIPVNSVHQLSAIPFGLLLTEAHKIPHVSLISGASTISLTTSGTSIKNTEDLFNALLRKNIPSILVQLTDNGIIDNSFIKDRFESFDAAGENNITCIAPVREVLSEICQVDLSECRFVYELIESLAAHKLILSYSGISISSFLNDGIFSIRRYSMNEVSESITAYRSRTRSYAAER